MKKDSKKNKNRKYAKNAELNLKAMPMSHRKMDYFKKKRTQNRIRTTINRTHAFMKFFSIVLLLWLCSRLMVSDFWYLPSNTFDVYPSKHLRIIGNRITPNDKIIKALKVIPIERKPLYLIDTVPYEDEIEKLSPVRKAFVRRYWLPARFEVTLEEEIPLITISPSPNAPEIAAMTAEGKVISKEYLPIKDSYFKTYKILTYDNYHKWSKKEILSLKILAQRIEDYSQEKLLYLDIRNQNDVYAQLETIKIRIGELNSTLKERVERLSSIMPQIENLKKETDYVDIRWDNTTYLKKKTKINIPIIKEKTIDKQSNEFKKTTSQSIKPTVTHKVTKTVVETKINPVALPQKQENFQKEISVPDTELPELQIQTIEP